MAAATKDNDKDTPGGSETKKLENTLPESLLEAGRSSGVLLKDVLTKIKQGHVTWGSIWADMQNKEQKRHENVWNAALSKYWHKFGETRTIEIPAREMEVDKDENPPEERLREWADRQGLQATLILPHKYDTDSVAHVLIQFVSIVRK